MAVGIIYAATSVGIHWHDFDSCPHQLNAWMAVSLASVVMNRCSHYLCQALSSEALILGSDEPDEFMLYSSPNGPPKWLRVLSICFLFPFFVIWTIVGAVWFDGTVKQQPLCFSPKSNAWVIMLWMMLCYLWASLYILFLGLISYTEWQAIRAERQFALIENEALIRRWGYLRQVGQWNFPMFLNANKGLPAERIAQLPYRVIRSEKHAQALTRRYGSCPICLDSFAVEDEIRKMSPCHHIFHRSCIDLWLIRSTDCPNCKQIVRSARSSSSSGEYPELSSDGSAVFHSLDPAERQQLLDSVVVHR